MPGDEFTHQPALASINLLPAYQAGLSGSGIRVGMMDSGINPNHVEFSNAIVAAYDALSDRSGNNNFPDFLRDYANHGTFTTSVLAARLDGATRSDNIQGVAYKASLVIAAMNFVGDDHVDAPYIVRALDYASRQSTRVINNSWRLGFRTEDPLKNYQFLVKEFPEVISAVKTALDRGSVLVVAAGNDAADHPGSVAMVPSFNHEVAAKGGWIVVAASTNDGKSLASYSNRCGISREYCITAPGGDEFAGQPLRATGIVGANGDTTTGYFAAFGTSAAAPMVSGAVALVAEQFPWMTQKNLASTLLTTATRAANPDGEWGRGLLDVGKAIKGPALFEEHFEADIPRGHASVFGNDIGYRAGREGGLIKRGAGTLTLTGANRYAGSTLIHAGALAVNGSLSSPVVVAADGLLRGTGRLSGPLTVQGTLAPGDRVGTLTVDNQVTMNSGSTLFANVAGGNAYGQLKVTGAVILPDNAHIDVNVTGSGYNTSGKLENLISAGMLKSKGTFQVTDNALLFNFGALKDGDTVDLTMVPDTAVSVQNIVSNVGGWAAIDAARAIDSALIRNPTGGLAGLFAGFTEGNQQFLSHAVAQTLPLLNGNSTTVTQYTVDHFSRLVQLRQDGLNGMSPGDTVFADQALWIKPFASASDQDDRGDQSGYRANTGGFVFGADTAISPASRIGLAFGYANTRTRTHSADAPHSAKIDVFHLLGYGSRRLDKQTELSVQVGIGQNHARGQRTIRFASGNAHAKYTSSIINVGIGLEKTCRLNERTSFLPSIRADYSRAKDNAYSETGSAAVAPLLLDVASHRADQLVLGVNGKLNHQLDEATTFSANLGAGYKANHRQAATSSAFAGAPGTPFVTYGLEQSPWLARAGLGLAHKGRNGLVFNLRYDAQYRSGYVNHSASLNLGWMF